MIKFLQNGIKTESKYVSVMYSITSNYDDNTIVIYARDYEHLPKELNPINESDSMTDYFESDRVYISPDSKYYADALKCCKKYQVALLNRCIKRYEKQMQSALEINDSFIADCRKKDIELCKSQIRFFESL